MNFETLLRVRARPERTLINPAPVIAKDTVVLVLVLSCDHLEMPSLFSCKTLKMHGLNM